MSLDSISILTSELARLTAASAEKERYVTIWLQWMELTHRSSSSLRLFSRLQFAKNIVYLIVISTDLTQHQALHCQTWLSTGSKIAR